jgi:hypothetical protein
MVHTKVAEIIIAANIGIIVFFTVAVAPTVFKVLPAQWEANLVGTEVDDGRLRTFKWLHGSSIALNIFQLGLFIWLLTIGAK